MQLRNRVSPQPEPGPLLGQPRCLLEDHYLQPPAPQGRGRHQPPDAGAYDRYP
jgi:hypothetical protein